MAISDEDLEVLRAVHRKAEGRPFEPPQPRHPFVLRMIEAGMLERRDGRFMFERMKDAFLAFTDAGHAAVAGMDAAPDGTVAPGP
jgi:hypothetical protein